MNLHRMSAGQGEPLVLLHGGMGSLNHWHRNFDELAQHYTVHALDMPGCGDSPAVPKDIPKAEYVALIIAALNDVAPQGSFRLAGFSFGGIIAALCAARMGKRVHKLSMIGPGGFDREQPLLDLRKIPPASAGDAAIRAVLAHNLRVMMIADPAKVTDEAVDLHYANVKRTRYDGRHFSLAPGSMAQCLKAMTCPAQIIWGERDAMCGQGLAPRVIEVHAARPDVRIDAIAGAGHWAIYEAAEAANRLMLAFLKSP